MRFFAVASGLLATALSVSAQLTAPMKNFNVTSPVSNGPYVAGQVLPCTYLLFQDVDSSSLKLQIVLQPASSGSSSSANASANSTVIIDNADVSKNDGSIKKNGNTTYYEHSINYNIPKTLAAGNYQVAFKDLSTNTELDVPIEIRPVEASSSVASASKTGSSSQGGESSMFAGAPSTKYLDLTTKTLLALAAVAGIAIML